jgi:predicted dehydrogenase
MPDHSAGRREFLLAAGAAAFTTSLFPGNLRGANDRVRVGFVGAGRAGCVNIGHAGRVPGLEIAAVCDVYPPALGGAEARARALGFDGVRTTRDYHAILADKTIDAVCISAPARQRARMTVEACEAGKDVWVEAPACARVKEGARMAQAARQYNRVVQTGTTGRSGGLFRAAREIVKSGDLGQIDFCRALDPGGALTGRGVHLLDLVQWAFDEATPLWISAQGETPYAMLATYRYPGFVASYESRAQNDGAGYSVSFHGTNATLRVSPVGCFVFPADRNARPLEQWGWQLADESTLHWRNFLECIRSRRRPASDIETCVRSTATCLLSELALRHGGTLDCDDGAFTVQRDDTRQYWDPDFHSAGSNGGGWGYTDRHPGS